MEAFDPLVASLKRGVFHGDDGFVGIQNYGLAIGDHRIYFGLVVFGSSKILGSTGER